MSEADREGEDRELDVCRIVVALDASLRSLAALEAAADIAAAWHAELLGLFVEDVELLRLAATPSAIRFLYPSGSEEPLSLLFIESELRALAEQARRELAAAAERAHVRWSFRIVRGNVSAEVLLAATEADLLTLGGGGWSIARRLGLGSTARAAISGARSSLLLVQSRVVPAPAVLAVYDRSPGAEDACRFAARLAAASSCRLTVFLSSPSGPLAREMEHEVVRLIQPHRLRIRLLWLASGDKNDFLRAVRTERGGVLVIGNRSPLLNEEIVERLLRETDHPLLLFGGHPASVLVSPREAGEKS
jgi:nucleotide-binding universal stress UspA family protein